MEASVKSRSIIGIKTIVLGTLLLLCVSTQAFAYRGYYGYHGGNGYGNGAAALGGFFAGAVVGGLLAAPTYTRPPVYYAPPAYYPPPVYYAPPPVYYPPPAYYAPQPYPYPPRY